jgi:hypothetical protein
LIYTLPILKERIEKQIQSGKIIPSYSQLIELSEGVFSEESIISFTSVYGEKSLPLAGLLIDDSERPLLDKVEPLRSVANCGIHTARILKIEFFCRIIL